MREKPDKDDGRIPGKKKDRRDKKSKHDAKRKHTEGKKGAGAKKTAGEKKLPFAKNVEAAFDHDVGKVHPHESKGPGAVGAKAYAMGEEIALKPHKAPSKLIGHELAHVVQQKGGGGDAKAPSKLPGKLNGKRDGKLDNKLPGKQKPLDLPHKNALEAAFGADLNSIKSHVEPMGLGKGGGAALAMGELLTFKQEPMMPIMAEEAIHASQQAGGKAHPEKLEDGDHKPKPTNGHDKPKPIYLKHPDADDSKEGDDDSDGSNGKYAEDGESADGKASKNGKAHGPKKLNVPADPKRKLEVPLDTDTLGALSDRMFDKLEQESKFERDVTGSD